MEKTDAQLVKEFLSGDQNAFYTLVERHKNAVYGLAFHLLRNFSDAEDIAQETFIQAYTNLSSLKEQTKFAIWLRNITHNICISFLRRQKGIESLLDEKHASNTIVMDKARDEHLQNNIERAINALSEKNQIVVTLHYIDGLSYKEIGDFLEIPVNTVKDRLRRAKEQLKEKMLSIVEEEFSEHRLGENFVEIVNRSIEERRNLTILVLMLEEGITEQINSFLKGVLEKYEGLLVENIGDACIVIFGLPVVHEDDVERAILAAMEVGDNFKLKAGINTGLAEVREYESEEGVCYKPLGSVLDIALELMENEGKILISESSYRLSLGRFSFREIKDGRYEVLDIADHPRKLWGIDGSKARMIGRDFELSQLKKAVNGLSESKGKIISIIGEAGLGKSRMVSELKADATGPLLWLAGRCVSYGKQVSYMPFLEILRTYFDIKVDDTGEKAAEKIKERTALFENSSEIIPYICDLLSVDFRAKDMENYTAERLRYKTFSALRTLFRHAAKEPLVIEIEDLQWIDEASYELLNFLVASVRNYPILFLCIYRPERDELCWQFRKQVSRKYPENYHEITLFRLSLEESRHLLRELIQRSLPSAVEEQVLEKAGGNPLFLEEIIRELAGSKKLVRIENGWKLKGEVEKIDVPETIFSVIMSRVDKLDEDTKHALRCASVIGDISPRRLLEEVFRDVKPENIQKIRELDLLLEDRQKSEYTFKHVLIKDAVYSSLLPEKRGELHERTAKAIEEIYKDRLEEFYEVLAYHWRNTDNAEKRVEYLLKAGGKSKKAYSNRDVVNYLGEVLELLDESDIRRAKAHEDLGEAYYILGEHTKAVPNLEKAITLAVKSGENPLELAFKRFKFAWGLIWLGRYDEAIKQAKAGLEVLGEDLANPQSALLSEAIAAASFCIGEPKGAEEHTLKNRDILKKLGYFDLIYKVYEGIAQFASYKGDIDSAIAWQKENENICEEHGNLMGVGEACIYLGYFLRFKGDFKEAIRYYEKGLKVCERCVNINFILMGSIWLGQALHLVGNDEEAETHFLKAIELTDVSEAIHRRFTGFAYYYFGDFCNDKGDFSRSIEILKKGVSFSMLEVGRAEEGLLISLAALERAYLSLRKEDEFKEFCENAVQQAKAEIEGLKLQQCYLEKCRVSDHFTNPVLSEEFNTGKLKPHLEWVDPRGDSRYAFKKGSSWLEIHSAAGCDLHGPEPDAPRIVFETSGDFGIETRLKASSSAMPSVGGLSIWKDGENLIQLERGLYEKEEISFSLKEERTRKYVGRGILPSSMVILRIERIGSNFSAYCSSDGLNWMICGNIMLKIGDPVQVGVHAIGGFQRRRGTSAAGRIDIATGTLYDYFRVFRRVDS